MPISKNAALRYRLIDECLCRDKVVWSRERLLEEVAAKFEEITGKTVSQRQLDLDIQVMKIGGSSGLDAPLEFDRRAGCYRYTEPGFSIRNSPLVVDDAEVLRQALSVLQQFQELGLSEELNKLVVRIEKQVNLHGQPAATPALQFEQVTNYTGAHQLRPLYQAIRQQQVLELCYQPFGAVEPKTLLIHPYLLKEFNHRWFLLAYNQTQDCLSNYALDRITSFQISKLVYQSEHRPDPAVYFQHVIGPSVAYDGVVEQVLLRFSKSRAPYVLTKPLHSSQVIVQQDEMGLQLALYVIPNRELRTLLLSFGSDVTVLAPESLRQSVAQEHRTSLAAYDARAHSSTSWD